MADTVTSAIFHPMGGVVATCSGQRHLDLDQDSDEETPEKSIRQTDNSLKVWSMPLLNGEMDANGDLHED